PIPGLEVFPDDIAQVFHTVYGNVGLRKIDKDELLDYEASLSLRLFNDNYLAREHEVGVKARLGLKANDDRLRGGIDAEAFISSPSDSTYSDINRNYAKIFPNVAYVNEDFNIKAGANIVMENDVIAGKSSNFHVFPNIAGAYRLSESFGVYAEYKGDVLRKTYYDFVMENPFLGPSPALRNSVQKFQIDAGIQGSLNEALTYKTGIKFG